MERTSNIVRNGTPVMSLMAANLPSPLEQNTTSLPFTFNEVVLKPKVNPADPDEFIRKPTASDAIKVTAPRTRVAGTFKDYLQEFHIQHDQYKARQLKF